MKTIGILGGMGPLATVFLYNKIVKRTKAEKDQDHIHIIIDSNTKIPDRTNNIIGDGEDPVFEMVSSAQMLEKAGADFIIMPCNTAHYFYDKIAQSIGIKLVNMLDETVKNIAIKYGCNKKVGLLATDGTNKSGIYEKYFDSIGSTLIKPIKTQKYVMDFIYNGIKKGDFNFAADGLLEAANEVKAKGAELILLGCTELSVANDIYSFEGNFVDPMDILALKAIELAGGTINNCRKVY